MARATGAGRRGGKGRPQKYDYVAILDHFVVGIKAGLSITECARNLSFIAAERGPHDEYIFPRNDRMKPGTAARLYHAIKPDPYFDAPFFAPALSPEVARAYARQLISGARDLRGREIKLPAAYDPSQKTKRGRPTKK